MAGIITIISTKCGETMIRSSDFILREVAGSYVVVPVGSAVADFNGMITLNEAGAYLWQALEQEQTLPQLAKVLMSYYEVTEEQALLDAEQFVKKLQATGAIL